MTTTTSLQTFRYFTEHREHPSFDPNAGIDSAIWVPGVDYQVTVEDSITKQDSPSDWKERLRAGRSATSSMTAVRRLESLANDGYGYVHAHIPGGIHRWGEVRGALVDHNLASVSDPSSLLITSVQNQAIQDINNQIRAASKSLQGLVALGELGESVRMVNRMGRDLFGRTRAYLSELQHLARYLTPQNLLRTVSERWIEYRFGIRPLVLDIGGFIDACYQNRYGRPPRVLIRTQRISTEKNPTTTSTYGLGHFLIRSKAEKSSTYGVRLYGAVGLTDSDIPPFSQEFGLTLDEFVPTLWELIPYSFLVDYASNIGAIVDAYSLNKSGVRWLAKGELRESETFLTATVTPSFVSSYVIDDSIVRPCTPLRRVWRQIDRNVSDVGSLIPSLEFRIPGSSTQWLNIAALAHLHSDTSHRLRQRLRGAG